jgi:hypothetical protein
MGINGHFSGQNIISYKSLLKIKKMMVLVPKTALTQKSIKRGTFGYDLWICARQHTRTECRQPKK